MTYKGRILARWLVGIAATVIAGAILTLLTWIGTTTVANLRATTSLQVQVAELQLQMTGMAQIPDRMMRTETRQADDEARIADNARRLVRLEDRR